MNTTDQQHFLAGKRIIIAGGGIGGLTFCIALQHFLDNATKKIEPPPTITVYERDTSVDAVGREGYSLSIRGDAISGGMQTLQKLGILDEMITESNPGTHFTLFNTDFSPLMQIRSPPVEGLSQSSFRIARSKLPDDTQEQCDLLIVADGSNSLIRKALRPEHVLNFAGAVIIAACTRTLDKSRESKAAGTIPDNEIDEILTEAKERTKVYGEPMPTLFKETLRSSVAVFNAKDMTPFRNHGSVIFIGDAQHAMSPFAGNGANMAIMDGYQLADQLVHAKDLTTAIQSYD
ncbi:unnamed protein product [Rotaria sp. Silwood2]|nr:unnamed protein product [Rotaria sp. Silwood2]